MYKVDEEVFYSYIDGIVNGSETHTKDYAGTHQTYYESKSYVKGDHHGVFGYSRSSSKMLYHVPRTRQMKWKDGDRVLMDYVQSSPVYYSSPLNWTPYFPDLDNCLAESTTKCLNNLVTNQVNLGASLGEGGQTLNMFLSNGKTLIDALIAAKRLQWHQIPGILGMSRRDVLSGRFPANKWLEYQYGWRPLMSDIYAGQQKIHEVIEQGSLIRASATSSTAIGGSIGAWGGMTVVNATASVRTVIAARIKNTQTRSINSWGLLNPLSVAWELVPFSFVVDWVMPIGNTFSALSATAGLEPMGGFRNVRKRWNLANTGESFSQGGDYTITTLNTGSFGTSGFSFSREVLNGFPLPQFYATNPFMDKKGDAKLGRIANALALLRQL